MKRGKPLERRTPLQRGTKGLKRGGRLKRVGAKARREKPALDVARSAVIERSHGICEAPAIVRRFLSAPERDKTVEVKLPPCVSLAVHAGCDPHHLCHADRDRGIHDPDRIVWLCRPTHDWVEDEPKSAVTVGLLIRSK